MKAIKYVTQLRQLDRDQQAKQESLPRLNKELEVQQIGQSWESRFAQVTKSSQRTSKERFTIEDSDEVPCYNPTLQVNDKFLPPDLTKLSSVQVVEMLKQSVIFDKSDICTKNASIEFFHQ